MASKDTEGRPKRKLRKPEFYLVITNVSLTSAASHQTRDGRTIGAGGQEIIDDYIKSQQQQLGLRGWLVWHADSLCPRQGRDFGSVIDHLWITGTMTAAAAAA